MKSFRRLLEDLEETQGEKLFAFTDADVQAAAHMMGLELIPLKELSKKKDRQHNQVCPCQLLKGLNVELEHQDLTGGNLLATAKIAVAHLQELPDYYTRLEKMEKAKK
jgi:hypothetical protein